MPPHVTSYMFSLVVAEFPTEQEVFIRLDPAVWAQICGQDDRAGNSSKFNITPRYYAGNFMLAAKWPCAERGDTESLSEESDSFDDCDPTDCCPGGAIGAHWAVLPSHASATGGAWLASWPEELRCHEDLEQACCRLQACIRELEEGLLTGADD